MIRRWFCGDGEDELRAASGTLWARMAPPFSSTNSLQRRCRFLGDGIRVRFVDSKGKVVVCDSRGWR